MPAVGTKQPAIPVVLKGGYIFTLFDIIFNALNVPSMIVIVLRGFKEQRTPQYTHAATGGVAKGSTRWSYRHDIGITGVIGSLISKIIIECFYTRERVIIIKQVF